MGHQNMLFMVGLNGLIHLLEPKRGIYYSDLTVFLLTCNKTYMEIFMVTEKKLVFIMKVAIQIIHVIINLMKQNLQQIILIGILIITLLKQRKLIGISFITDTQDNLKKPRGMYIIHKVEGLKLYNT